MSSQAAALGNLPEWNLADLYPSPASAEFAADLKRGEAEAKAFAEQHRGKLATLSGEELAKAVETYEALSDLLGRLGSYAQLHYVGDTSDPQRAKFYGDANAKLTGLPITGRGSRTCARRSPISSSTGSRNCSSKSRRPAMRRGIACLTKRWRTCALPSRARPSASSRL